MNSSPTAAWKLRNLCRHWWTICAFVITGAILQGSSDRPISVKVEPVPAAALSDSHESDSLFTARSDARIWMDLREIGNAADEGYTSAIPSWLDGSMQPQIKLWRRNSGHLSQIAAGSMQRMSFQLAIPLQI